MGFESIPSELKSLNQFVVYRLPNKIPLNPSTLRNASCSDPSTWSDFDTALNVVAAGNATGIGFQFTESDPFLGIDFDHVLFDGKFSDESVRSLCVLLWKSKTYAEISSSGSGLHFIVKNSLPESILQGRSGGRKFADFCEIYQSSRYFALTGNLFFPRSPSPKIKSIESRLWSRILKVLDSGQFDQFLSLDSQSKDLDPLSWLISSNSKFSSAFNGSDSDFPSKSERDFYLLMQLFQLYGDRSVVESVFLSSQAGSQVSRKVRHESDYVQRSLRSAENKWISDGSPRYNNFSSNSSKSSQSPDTSLIPTIIQSDNYLCTDLENSRRLAQKCNNSVRFCYDLDQFYRWTDDSFWSPVNSVNLYDFCESVSDDFESEANRCSSNQSLSKRLFNGARLMRMNSSCDRAIDRLKSFPEFIIRSEVLDSIPNVLPFKNGYLDLDTGEFMKHRRDLMFTRLIDYPFESSANDSLWNQFLDDVLPDESVRIELQKFMGYSLLGSVEFEKFAYIYGSGGNGKGTFLRCCMKALGSFAQILPINVFNAGSIQFKDGESPNPHLARLKGSRLVVSDEIPPKMVIDVAMLKSITGGDRIVARQLRKDPIEFDPTFKLVLCGNERAQFNSINDDGLNRRLLYFEFKNKISDPDPRLKYELSTGSNLSVVMDWMLAGLLKLRLDQGFIESESMLKDKEDLVSMDDVVGSFLSESCYFDPDARIKRSEFNSRFISSNGSISSADLLRLVLRDPRITLIKPNNVHYLKGVGWIEENPFMEV